MACRLTYKGSSAVYKCIKILFHWPHDGSVFVLKGYKFFFGLPPNISRETNGSHLSRPGVESRLSYKWNWSPANRAIDGSELISGLGLDTRITAGVCFTIYKHVAADAPAEFVAHWSTANFELVSKWTGFESRLVGIFSEENLLSCMREKN